MVVLEAAAIGAAGYGLYRGGDAAVRKGKDCVKEYKREQKRSEQKSELDQKRKARSDRVAQLASIRRGMGSTTTTTTATTQTTTTSAPSASAPSFLSRSLPTATNPTSISSRSSVSGMTDIDERHRNVMEKLRSSRREESAKATSSGKFNPFKRK